MKCYQNVNKFTKNVNRVTKNTRRVTKNFFDVTINSSRSKKLKAPLPKLLAARKKFA